MFLNFLIALRKGISTNNTIRAMKYLFVLFCLTPGLLSAQLKMSFETGAVSTGYNDVRVPNGSQNTGTLFSFTEDFDEGDAVIFFRGALSYMFADKHIIEVTAVPLTRDYTITTDRELMFAGNTFQGLDVTGSYQFNTYRASYRYRLLARPKFTLDLGASLLVRDARIALSQGFIEADDTDLGYVPLVSFDMSYSPTPKLSVVLKGDALVGPVGRAEDVFAGFQYKVYRDDLQIKAGYRIIEGGADVDQVYNFALFHFANVGLVLNL